MDLKKSIGKQTDFSLNLAKHVGAKKAADSNLVFSPLSIHVVLSLVAAGSKGQTLDQLVSFLGSDGAEELNSLASQIVSVVLADGSVSGGPRVSFVNGVWVEQSLSLKPSFKEIVGATYKAEAKAVDFQTKSEEVRNEVNSWVQTETTGLIKELLPPTSVDYLTRLIFANALYFKGEWINKFDAKKTKEEEFHLLDGTSVRVPFMTSQKKQFLSSYDGFKVLRLPYAQGADKRQFSMHILLPDKRDGLKYLAEKMGSESEFLDRHSPTQRVEVCEFLIPKSKISFGFEVSRVLKELGLALPFSGLEAELTEMVESPVGQPNLFVSGLFHKSFIEVNEEGTEAAASTAATIELLSYSPPMDFVADHPFMFFIREDTTGMVTFVGHVINPSLVD